MNKVLNYTFIILLLLILISGLIFTNFYDLSDSGAITRQQLFESLSQLLGLILVIFSAKILSIKRSWDYLFVNIAFISFTLFNVISLLDIHELININPMAGTELHSVFKLINLLSFALLIFLTSFFRGKIIEQKQYRFSLVLTYGIALTFLFIIIALAAFFSEMVTKIDFYKYLTHLIVTGVAALLLLLSGISEFRIYHRNNFISCYWFLIVSICFLFSNLYMVFNFEQIPFISDIVIILQCLGLAAFFFVLFNEHTRILETETKLRSSLEKELHATEKNLRNFQALINEIDVGIMVLDNEGKIIFCNTQLEMMLDTPHRKLIGTSYTKVIDQVHLDKFQFEQEKWQECISSQFEINLNHRKNEKIPVLMVSTPVLNIKKQYCGSRHVTIEISRWKEIEKSMSDRSENLAKIIRQRTEALRKKSNDFEQSKNYHESLIAGMLDILLVMDNKGRCTFINEYGKKVLGYQAHELTGKQLPVFFTDVKRVKKDYGSAVNFELRDYECNLKSKEGPVLQLSWNVRHLIDANGQHSSTMYVGRDIAEMKNLRRQLQEQGKNSDKLVAERTNELNTKVQQMEKIIQIGEDIVLNLDLNVILRNICETIRVLGWEIVIISLRDFKTNPSGMIAAAGISDKKFNKLAQENKTTFRDILNLMNDKYKISNSYFIDHTAQVLKPNSGLGKSISLKRIAENQWHPGDTLLIPIKIKNRILGYITVHSPKDGHKPNIDKTRTLEIFANKAAVVIENARLFQKAQGRAGEMEHVSQLKTKFLANMSHELRTPLNSILSLTEILLKQIPGKINQEQIKQVSIIQENGKNLLILINNLLDLSKIDVDKMDLNHNCISIKDVINANVEMIRPLCLKKGLKLSVSLSKKLPEFILSDQDKISQVLTNLLSNAVKFTEHGKISISAKAEKDNSYLIILVRDNGIGMSGEDLKTIFDDFQQLENNSLTKAKGTGLGLSISKKIIELMEGTISVESKPNKGTTFKITLPIKAVGENQAAKFQDRPGEKAEKIKLSFNETDIEESVQKSAVQLKGNKTILPPAKSKNIMKAKPVKSAANVSSKRHILLVDDNADNQYAMSYFLKERGYRISFACNGKEAVEKAIALRPALILMDIMMPELDGYQATKILKSRNDFDRIPIIAMTAKAMREDQLKALQAGCDDYIAKPFNLDQIALKIEKWIG